MSWSARRFMTPKPRRKGRCATVIWRFSCAPHAGSAPLAAQMLESEGIPVFCDAGEGYFDIPEIRAMTALLQTIENGARDEPLLAALRGPALGLERKRAGADSHSHAGYRRSPIMKPCAATARKMEDALAEKLRAFEAKRARWRLCARNQGVDQADRADLCRNGLSGSGGRAAGRRGAAGEPAPADRAGAGVRRRRRAARCTRFCGMPSGCARAATA